MMTEMLHSKRVSSEERKSEYYSVMLEETEHLSHLIDNILDFSRLEDERKKYHYEDQDLIELLERFLDSIGERLREAGFTVRFDHPSQVPFIRADKDALHQVFYNLVDNAIKYSGNSRQVDISLVVRDEEVLVSVKDYGIGISRSDQEKIFERFYRSEDPQTKDVKGSGIGLTIVKKIVEAHRGHLTLESRPGKGSTFCIHLPISNNKEQ
jgi:two-component system phosphate regulon sensor histidine kinase PhoR